MSARTHSLFVFSKFGTPRSPFPFSLFKPAGNIFTINVTWPETLQVCRRVSWPKCDRARSGEEKGVTLQFSLVFYFYFYFFCFITFPR